MYVDYVDPHIYSGIKINGIILNSWSLIKHLINSVNLKIGSLSESVNVHLLLI